MTDVDRSLETLLSNASPRPQPDSAHVATARDVVRAEWRSVTGKHRSEQTFIRFAVAASIVIGVFFALNNFRAVESEVARVAAIQKSFGAIYVLGERAELELADDLTTIRSGQTIVTGDDAGVALAWNSGGSLRLDANTEIEFRDSNSVYLQSGRIYFDSMPSALVAGISTEGVESFQVETEFGTVSHIGTQFMTHVDSDVLITSVREGRVEIAGRYYSRTAAKGKQVVFSGRQRPVELSFPEYGDAWNWVRRVSPAVDVDGQSIDAFLNWVARELGVTVEYATDEVAVTARNDTLIGQVDADPGEALRLRMLTTALNYQIVEGVIYVRDGE